MEGDKAQMGVLVLMCEPTRGMFNAADRAGNSMWPVNGQTFPRIQIITVPELLEQHKRPDLPPAYLPYVKAERLLEPGGEQTALFA